MVEFPGESTQVAGDAVENELGFPSIRRAPRRKTPEGSLRALVLAQQEVTVGGAYDYWDDLAGERFHFPNTYRHKVQSGLPFVYYRGTRRAGGKSGTPEYFGTGRIGHIWRDTAAGTPSGRRQRWYCSIIDYLPFVTAVPWTIDGHEIETIPRNVFRNAVRDLPFATFRRILTLSGVTGVAVPDAFVSMPALNSVVPVAASKDTSLLAPPSTESRAMTGEVVQGRRSRQAVQIGRRAELVGVKFLKRLTPAPAEVTDIAGRGETPGWDLEYRNAAGDRVLVEVKGTSASRFAAIEITANEWRAAATMRERYVLMLVADSLSRQPVIELIWDPVGKHELGEVSVEPAVLRLERARVDS